MQSASKIKLDDAMLSRLCRKFLQKDMLRNNELADGGFNTLHVLELSDSTKVVLKVSPPPAFQPMRYERNIMATEVAVHRRLAQAGLRAPRGLVDNPGGEEPASSL